MNTIFCRQIIARLTQTLDENSGTGQKLNKIYADLGISLRDSEGQLRSTYDILSDLSEQWGNLDGNTQQYIALTSAGSNQVNNFLALMNNFGQAVNATSTALHSAGSAMKENEAYMDSIDAKLNLIKANFQQLVNGDGGLNKLIKVILDLANALLTFANSGLGQFTIAMGLATAAVVTFLNVIKSKSEVSMFAYAISELIAGGATLTEVISVLTAELLANPLFWGAAAVAGIYAVIKAFDAFNDNAEESIEAFNNLSDQYDATSDSIENLKSQIDDIKSKLEEVNQKKLEVTTPEQTRELTLQSNELEGQLTTLRNQLAIELEKEASLKRQKEDAAEALKSENNYGFTTANYQEGYDGTEGYSVTSTGSNLEQSFRDSIEVLKQLKQEYEELQKQIDEFDGDEQSEEYKELTESAQEYKEQIDELVESMSTSTEAAKDVIDLGLDEKLDDAGTTFQDLLNTWYDLTGVSQEVDEKLQEIGVDLDENAEKAEETKTAIEQINEAYNEHLSNLTEIQSAYETLTAAVEQYNSTGAFTAETLSKLNGLTAQQMAALELHNGVMSVNVDLLRQQFEAEKQEMINKLQLAKQIAIVALEEQYLNQEAQATGATLEVQQTINEDTATTYQDIYTAASQAAAGVAKVRAALGADSDEYKQFLEERKSIMDDYDKMIDEVKNTEIDLATTSQKTSKSAGKAARDAGKEAEKAAKDAEKAWEEAYEKEKAVLEHMHEMGEISDEEFYRRLLELNEQYFGEASGHHEKYLKEYLKNEEEVYKGLANAYKKKVEKQKKEALKAIDAEIKGVKKAKDAALKAIDERIKAIKRQKEEAIKAIEAEIKALNKQKEAQHKYFQDKIDALQRAHDLQEQINKLEEYENQLAQAKAQKVWVMKDGQFQLGEDEAAVNSAEQQLSDYKDDLDYERQIQELQDLQNYWDEYYEHLIEQKEEYKEYIEEYYDNQIEAMEEYRDRVEEEYDAQIEALEEYRDQVEEMYDNMLENYEEHVKQMLEKFDEFNKGNEEKYGKAIEDLRAFIAEWNALIGSMSSIDGSLGAMTSGLISLKGHSSGAAEIGSYASGNSSSVRDDEIALVGESPNTEMLIGSKVNTGVVARLHKGSGVVNAQSTKTLAGILNSLGKNSYVGGSGTNGVTQNFSFGAISLPNVTDANSFVETLKNTFGTYSIQFATGKA